MHGLPTLSDLLSAANVSAACLHYCTVRLHVSHLSVRIYQLSYLGYPSVPNPVCPKNMTPLVLGQTIDLVYSWLVTRGVEPGMSKGKSAVALHIDLWGCSLVYCMGTYAVHLC